jgi:5-methylcytosine-specific restriction endonuclease McrA
MGSAQHRRNRHRRARAGGEATYDGVPDRWRASIDHIISLAGGGWDIAANKRAAHQRCNEAAHWPDGRAQEPAPPPGRAGLSFTIGGDRRLREALERYLAGE